MHSPESWPLAIVPGASTGIGYYLAMTRRDGWALFSPGLDLLIAADEPHINKLRRICALSWARDGGRGRPCGQQGSNKLLAAARAVSLCLLANAAAASARDSSIRISTARHVVRPTSRHDLSIHKSRSRCGRGEGKSPYHTRLDRRLMPALPASNTHQGFPRLVFLRVAPELKATDVNVTC